MTEPLNGLARLVLFALAALNSLNYATSSLNLNQIDSENLINLSSTITHNRTFASKLNHLVVDKNTGRVSRHWFGWVLKEASKRMRFLQRNLLKGCKNRALLASRPRWDTRYWFGFSKFDFMDGWKDSQCSKCFPDCLKRFFTFSEAKFQFSKGPGQLKILWKLSVTKNGPGDSFLSKNPKK